MSLTALTTTELGVMVALVAIVVAGVTTMIVLRQRRTERLRSRFGGAEYDRAVKDGGNRRHGEAGLDQRTERVEGLHIRPLALGDRARFLDAWRAVQARFVDGPAGSVVEADQLLGDVMTTRGYPVGDFEQRAADISVDHPLVLANYRTAHDITLRHTRGEATTEDLRRAMVHYRTLFEELVNGPEAPIAQAAS